MTCGLPEVLQTKYFSFPFALQENAAAYFRIYSRRWGTIAGPVRAAGRSAPEPSPLAARSAAPRTCGPAAPRPPQPRCPRRPRGARSAASPAYLRRGARGPPGPEPGSGSGPAGRRGRGGRSRAAPRGRGRRRGRRLPRRRWGGPAAAWAAPGSSRAPAPGSEAAR